MIIDFSVKNFRSFRDEQKISFVAATRDDSIPDALIDPKLPGVELSKLRLLKSLAIYGGNAAGKTNVLKALAFLTRTVLNSADKSNSGEPTGVEPFLLGEEMPHQPSEFVLRFIVNGVRYHFVLVLNKQRILYESLSAFPKGREQVWYERSWDDEAEEYDWGSMRRTGYTSDPNLIKYTRENALYLSTAVQFNDGQLEPVYLWFKEKIRPFGLDMGFFAHSPEFTAHMLNDSTPLSELMVELLRYADLGISSARVVEREHSRDDFPENCPEEILKQLLAETHTEVYLEHQGIKGRKFELDWSDESAGTRRFFALIGPWVDINMKNRIALLDEIESSLHPAMVKVLLELLLSYKTTSSTAQMRSGLVC